MRLRQFVGVTGIVIAAALGAAGSVASQAPLADSLRPQVRTVGTAVRHLPPTLAVVRLNFLAEGRSPKEAGARLAARADSLRRALVSIGVARDSLVTASQWYWWGGRVEIVVSNGRFVQLPRPDSLGRMQYNLQDTSYRARDGIEVRIRELGKIGPALDTALAHGITDISPVQFQVSEVAATRDQALREATEDARRQADAIAVASGMRLGRVLSLSTYSEVDRYPYPVLSELSIRSGENNGGTEVIPRSIPVSVTVYARWELLPRQ